MEQSKKGVLAYVARCLRRYLLGWRISRLGFVTPIVGEVVRSPGYDNGHDKESRNGRDITIDILDDYVWTSEGFRLSLESLLDREFVGRHRAERVQIAEVPHKENLPEEPKQHHPAQAAVSSAASRGRYARSRVGWASKDRSTPCVRSRAACASKERSTPEGINMEEHGFRFQFTFPEPDYGEYGADFGEEEDCLPRQRKPPEFELVEVPVIREFWEFGGGCIHYNFTAKQAEDHHHSADADSTKLFFYEVNSAFHGEKDVVLCCIVGEHDNGHCYGCEGFKPTVVHPSSQAYGGGSSTCIDFAGSDGSSESD
uniref:DUF3615 domain-containing protein n=1 Tax=Aegilops tauschii TaxID=37682 RepID=M8C027_AEGTA